jgi:hypothetical protein
MAKRTYLKPILTLVFIIPFLTELISGNLLPSKFFQPHIFLLLSVVYGVVVLIIRELSVKWQLGIEGIFVLGIAYGIYNEGICAKTLLMAENVPLAQAYGHYNLFAGINLAWAMMILLWHSLHAVVYPILILDYLYPQAQYHPWLNQKWSISLTAIFSLIGIGMFLNPGGEFQSPAVYLVVFIVIIGLLILLSKAVVRTRPLVSAPGEKGFRTVAVGFGMFSYTLGSIVLASMSVPVIVLFVYAVVMMSISYKIILTKKWLSLRQLLLVAWGNYFADAVLLFMGGLGKQSAEMYIAGAGFLVFLVIFALLNR